MSGQGFPEHLRSLRAAARMSRAELGRRAGCTDRAIKHYETGNREPAGGVLIGMAGALGVSAEYLWSGVIKAGT